MRFSNASQLRGRQAQLNNLRLAAEIRGRHSWVVALRGQAGSGRSALLRAAAPLWRADGLRVARAPLEIPGVSVMPGTVLVADRADITVEALRTSVKPGCLTVVTCSEENAELAESADLVIDLPPLDDDTAAALLHDDLGLDAPAVTALRTALGPWFGNPGTLVTVVRDLLARNRLRPVRDRLCLADPEAPIALPASHFVLRRSANLAGPTQSVLKAVTALGKCDLVDLPHVVRADAAVTGRTVDALVETGALEADREGRLRISFPALAAAVSDRQRPADVRAIHQRCARRLIAKRRRGQPIDEDTLADHLAACGADLVEAGDVPAWLVERAEEVAQYDADRAGAWWIAAWRLGADVDPLRFALDTGTYGILHEVCDARLATAGPELRWDLAVLAMLVELDGGEPVPALTEEPPCRLAGWWRGRHGSWEPAPPRADDSERLMSTAELNAIYHALSTRPRECADALRSARQRQAFARLDELIEAGAQGDVASALEIMLGPRYRVPRTGVLAAYQRVLRAYVSADWNGSLQAIRQLELLGDGDGPAHHLARLYAAGVHLARGELRHAVPWLSSVSGAPRFALARATVETAMLHRRGASAAALDLARRTLQQTRRLGFRPGRERLLLTTLQIALRSGDKVGAKTLMREIAVLHREENSRCTRQTLLLARGLLYGDVSSATKGVELAHQRGHRPDVLWACHILARFCDDPRHVIDELNLLAQQTEPSSLLPAQIDALLARFGAGSARPSGGGPFSSHELGIIEMVTSGWTNRQIAMKLNVSEKVVENTMTRLLARAGCRSRVELAAAHLAGRLAETK
ncbi:LuxR C-terminal-related transcriptional regulator [Streptomyces sp. NRRL S-1022]|uniref:LuxR C-terminal-related transcriptional regulator n=1 Tax=Streptomyces sp. NRRL S-1022 TaxID=1463880 RepID=UPI0004C1C7CB|nr:LuxR C-terminal-related transcriptional regulator [Streptomyces sp. NRRL S-1022]